MKLYKLDNRMRGSYSAVRFASALAAIFVVYFALGLGSSFSQSDGSRFLRLDFVPGSLEGGASEQHGRYILSFDGSIKAKICRESSIPLFYTDILGARVESNPFLMNFERGPVKMARLTQISENPPVLRATFFLKRSLLPTVKYIKNSMEITFSQVEEKKLPEKRDSYSLIDPAEKKRPAVKQQVDNDGTALPLPQEDPADEPTRIKVSNSDAATLMRELARQTGKSIHFRDPVQTRVELDISAADPFAALNQIAGRTGYAVTVEDGDIWVSRLENPLLKISEKDQVEGADLSNLALGDVLRALGQIAEVNIALDKSLESVKERKVNIYFQKISVRRAFETLIKVHDLFLAVVDEKTLLVMTLENSRQIEGKVVRILPLQVPFEKLNSIISESVSSDITARVKTQEDLGNLILTGDREAVDIYETAARSLEGKMMSAGDSFSREYFNPLNTKPEDLIALIKENLGEKEGVKITFDKRTDMVLVSGPSTSVNRVVEMARRLDLDPTRQALIHIRLIEIKRKDMESMGIKLPDQLAQTSDIANFSASSIVIPANFTAFQDNNRIKTLANPTLRCMDKEEASIDIVEKIPIKNATTNFISTGNASPSVSISDNWSEAEVGIKLNVQPFIHQDNEITMKVDIDLTELLDIIETRPWTAQRKIKTMVRVKDKETVVIGGLIRNKKTTTKRPLPFLSKIPILRKLVRKIEHNADTEEKSEMVILITPNVVDSAGRNVELPHSKPGIKKADRGN